MFFTPTKRQTEFFKSEANRQTITEQEALRRALDETIDRHESDQLAE